MITFTYGDGTTARQIGLKISTYPNKNLAIKMYLKSGKQFDFWDSLLVNLQGSRPLNHGFINTKSLGQSILTWIEHNHLAVPSGQLRHFEGYEYSEYCFHGDMLMKLDPDGYTYYFRCQKGEIGRKYERLYIALKRLAKNITGFHYTDYSGWKEADSALSPLPLWIDVEDSINNRKIRITHKGALMRITVTDSSGKIQHIHCRRKEDLASDLLALFQSK